MKLNLRADQKKLRAYVEKRIRYYGRSKNQGPGKAGDAISLVTFGFYAEQGGYVNLVFDTRPKAKCDGEWTLHIDNERNTCDFPKWCSAYESLYDDKPMEVTRHDGKVCTLKESHGDERINRVFGEMIADLMVQLRDEGALQKLPLAPKARMVLEEFDGRYSWPGNKESKEGVIA